MAMRWFVKRVDLDSMIEKGERDWEPFGLAEDGRILVKQERFVEDDEPKSSQHFKGGGA